LFANPTLSAAGLAVLLVCSVWVFEVVCWGGVLLVFGLRLALEKR